MEKNNRDIQLEFKTFEELSPTELEETFRIYSSSFLPLETKRVETVMTMLRMDKNYRLIVAKGGSKIVGFSLLYSFAQLKVGLLDYMAVIPSEQGKGIGQAIFRHTFCAFQQTIQNPMGLLLEVQKEDYAKDQERTIRENRIRFYRMLGAKLLFESYLLPPQVGTEAEITYLLIVPCKEISHISGDHLLKIIEAIHSNVYKYDRKDLIERMARSIPVKVEIRNIHVAG